MLERTTTGDRARPLQRWTWPSSEKKRAPAAQRARERRVARGGAAGEVEPRRVWTNGRIRGDSLKAAARKAWTGEFTTSGSSPYRPHCWINVLDLYLELWETFYGLGSGIPFDRKVCAIKATQISSPPAAFRYPWSSCCARHHLPAPPYDFQTVSSLKDSLLELTGPIRAVLLRAPCAFEINLRVKGNGSNTI